MCVNTAGVWYGEMFLADIPEACKAKLYCAICAYAFGEIKPGIDDFPMQQQDIY